MTTAFTLVYDGEDSACGHVHAEIPILVAGKGEIDLVMTSTGCIDPAHPGHFAASRVTVSGGSGLYANASGSGVLDTNSRNPTATHSWTGTLNVAGLTFDTTPPQIVGATARTAKARAAKKGTRVRYAISATDATDGPVPAACDRASGNIFRVGRTTVTCTSVDSSGNTAIASFVVTVKRVR